MEGSVDLGDRLHTEMVYPPTQTVSHPSTNPAVHGRELSLLLIDHKSDTLTTKPPSHLICVNLCANWFLVPTSFLFRPGTTVLLLLIFLLGRPLFNLIQKSQGSVLSNRIRIIFGIIVPQVNRQNMRQADTWCAHTWWQQFSVWNYVMVAILTVWRQIENPTPSVSV